jgi:hypothetical protein
MAAGGPALSSDRYEESTRLDALVGKSRAFINLTARFVAQPELLASVPTDRVVLEILEYVDPTQAVRDGLARLVRTRVSGSPSTTSRTGRGCLRCSTSLGS